MNKRINPYSFLEKYPNERTSYPNERTSYLNERTAYLNERTAYPNERTAYPNERTAYPNERTLYLNERTSYPNERTPYLINRYLTISFSAIVFVQNLTTTCFCYDASQLLSLSRYLLLPPLKVFT